MTVEEIINAHPVPWRHVVQGGGIIRVIDASNKIVELFTVLEFVQGVTLDIAIGDKPTAAAS